MKQTARWRSTNIFNIQVVSSLGRSLLVKPALEGQVFQRHFQGPSQALLPAAQLPLALCSDLPPRAALHSSPCSGGLSGFSLCSVFTSLNVLIYKERSYSLIAGKQRLLGRHSVLELSLEKMEKALVTQTTAEACGDYRQPCRRGRVRPVTEWLCII